jgi:hypothetical protein
VKYIAVITQEGEGCDYTIGCGVSVEGLAATDEAAALAEVREWFLADEEPRYGFDQECQIASVTLYPYVQSIKIDLPRLQSEHFRRLEEQQHERRKATELAQLKRLSEKYPQQK